MKKITILLVILLFNACTYKYGTYGDKKYLLSTPQKSKYLADLEASKMYQEELKQKRVNEFNDSCNKFLNIKRESIFSNCNLDITNFNNMSLCIEEYYNNLHKDYNYKLKPNLKNDPAFAFFIKSNNYEFTLSEVEDFLQNNIEYKEDKCYQEVDSFHSQINKVIDELSNIAYEKEKRETEKILKGREISYEDVARFTILGYGKLAPKRNTIYTNFSNLGVLLEIDGGIFADYQDELSRRGITSYDVKAIFIKTKKRFSPQEDLLYKFEGIEYEGTMELTPFNFVYVFKEVDKKIMNQLRKNYFYEKKRGANSTPEIDTFFVKTNK